MAAKFNLKEFLATVAPTLGMALGGPLGGVAGQVLARKLGKEKATPEELEAAVMTAAPEDLAKIKEADLEFQKMLQENEIKLVDLDNVDRADARAREVVLKDWTPSVLAGCISVGFFGVILWMLKFGLPTNGDQPLLVLLGALGTAFGSIVAYFFGSSASSKAKDVTISTALRTK